jgi:hypothetical protein
MVDEERLAGKQSATVRASDVFLICVSLQVAFELKNVSQFPLAIVPLARDFNRLYVAPWNLKGVRASLVIFLKMKTQMLYEIVDLGKTHCALVPVAEMVSRYKWNVVATFRVNVASRDGNYVDEASAESLQARVVCVIIQVS